MPDTRGVIILRVYFKMRLMTISTDDATMQVPKISGSPPSIPAEMIGPINEKLVPWIHKKAGADTSYPFTLDKGRNT